jgi:hypothetical protein
MAERPDNKWRGGPLDVGGIAPRGIEEMVVEYDTGDEEVLKPRLRDEYGSYELQQAATSGDAGRRTAAKRGRKFVNPPRREQLPAAPSNSTTQQLPEEASMVLQ